MNEILKRLSAINLEVEAIKKEKTNVQQNFKYRGIDQVMNDLHSLFTKNEVIITSEPLSTSREERVNRNGTTLIWTVIQYKFTFHAPDGSSLSSTAVGEAMDSGDKGANKCISVALKYVLFNMFLIPTEEMRDPDGESHEVGSKGTVSAKTPALRQPVKDVTTKKEEKAPIMFPPFDLATVISQIEGCTDYIKLKTYWSANKKHQADPEFKALIDKQKAKLTAKENA